MSLAESRLSWSCPIWTRKEIVFTCPIPRRKISQRNACRRFDGEGYRISGYIRRRSKFTLERSLSWTICDSLLHRNIPEEAYTHIALARLLMSHLIRTKRPIWCQHTLRRCLDILKIRRPWRRKHTFIATNQISRQNCGLSKTSSRTMHRNGMMAQGNGDEGWKRTCHDVVVFKKLLLVLYSIWELWHLSHSVHGPWQLICLPAAADSSDSPPKSSSTPTSWWPGWELDRPELRWQSCFRIVNNWPMQRCLSSLYLSSSMVPLNHFEIPKMYRQLQVCRKRLTSEIQHVCLPNRSAPSLTDIIIVQCTQISAATSNCASWQ